MMNIRACGGVLFGLLFAVAMMNIRACGGVLFGLLFAVAMNSGFYRFTILVLVTGLGQVLGQAEESQPAVVPTSQAEFNRDIFPIMKDVCFGCHGNKRAKAELNLEAFAANPDFFRDGRTWEHVSKMLRHREMPPENKKQPTEDQRIMLIEFIEKELAKFDCSNPAVPVNPGRVTLRRLNRSEYNNTIRDLFGVDYQLSLIHI